MKSNLKRTIAAGLLSFCCICTGRALASGADTVIISPESILTKNLPLGTHKYLIYFKKGADSSRISFQFWNLEVSEEKYKGKDAIVVKQLWEDNTSVIHTAYSVSDKKDFRPIFQRSWWKNRGTDTITTDFETRKAFFPDKLFRKDIEASRKTAIAAFEQACASYSLNWHLDLETFSMLPFKTGRTFGINFYDAGFSAPKLQYYTVSGSGKLEGYDGNVIDCWLLMHESPGNKEKFWISKKTNEVLKLEQQSGPLYRYKIKLGFSK